MKSILFNGSMVQAIQEGRKTVTRRIVKPQPKENTQVPLGFVCASGNTKDIGKFGWGLHECGGKCSYANPPYQIGDILYVRETWKKDVSRFMYKANYSESEKFYQNGEEVKIKWKPSIHMPKSAARIFLKVTDVKVERLQDITDEQAKAESFEKREGFLDYWDEMVYKNDKTRFKTECGQQLSKSNPWVWVIEFEKVDKESEGEQ